MMAVQIKRLDMLPGSFCRNSNGFARMERKRLEAAVARETGIVDALVALSVSVSVSVGVGVGVASA